MANENESKVDGQSGGVNIGAGAQVRVDGDLVGRDKITVGAGATNVAVNSRFIFQNNVRIGKLVVPARLIFALVAVVLVVAVAAWFVFVPAQMPLHRFNVAVANFGQLDAQGKVQDSADGYRLSQWMFGKLQDETASLPQGTELTLWHDSLGFLKKRTPIGNVADEAAAARLAKQINAQVIIYGNLAANQNPATFAPTFYVADLKGEADEIVGSQQLGRAIAVQLPLDFNDPRVGTYLEKNFTPRAQALVWFTRGLTADLIGDYAGAYRIFAQAEQQTPGWNDDDGKEVLYYFIGREALFVGRNETEAKQLFGSVEAAWDAAENAFTRARALNPKYARAYFGLGQVDFQRAQRILLTRSSNPSDLARARDLINQSISFHQTALQLVPQSGGSNVGIKTRAALASSHLLEGSTYSTSGDWAGAEPFFKQAAGEYQAVLPLIGPADFRFLAQVHLALAAAWNQDAQALEQLGDKTQSKALYQAARDEYQKCSAQADLFPYDSVLADLKNQTCQPQRDEVQKILDRMP